ncbi:MAG: hypothetical protein EOO14_07595 [Chitinophagaceae bacterium]|nr:MAG: hypothetical protein EOO14_07595 [Chitinophagaceae bacterium]
MAVLQIGNEKPIAPALIPATAVEAADANAVKVVKASSAVVIPVAAGSNYLSVNFVTVPGVTAAQLKQLLPLKKQLVWLKLNDARITDEHLVIIGQLTSLRTLYLNNTVITDKGLLALKPLANLQVLSVVNTKVSAAGLASLSKMKNLHSLFAYQTAVKVADTPMLRKTFPLASIDIGGYTLPLLSSDTARLGLSGR